MTLTEIHLPRKLMQQVLHQAQQQPELEICGFIGAKQQQPIHCYPIENIAQNPCTEFLFAPQQHIAAFKQMRERGEDLFAIYHSHPSAAAEPSLTDIAWATYPNAIYLIISLNIKGILELRGFKIETNEVNEVRLCLT
jgi:proteasome lid subunit RPN8/RPN11